MRAFEGALPAAWTVDVPAQGHDYGIDASVELFEDDGEPLALGFLAQVKATDGDQLSISLPTDTWRHYLRLDRPVLLVRYLAGTDTLYTRWAHRVRVEPPPPDQQTITVRWTLDDRWSPETPNQLVADVTRLRDARQSLQARPVEIHAKLQPGGALSPGIARALRRALRSFAREARNAVELSFEPFRPPSTLIHVDVGGDGVSVDFGGIAGTHADLPSDLEDHTQRFAATVFALVGVVASRVGHDLLAGELLDLALPQASIRHTPSFAGEAVLALTQAGRADALDAYIGSLAETAHEIPDAVFTLSVAVTAARGPVGVDLGALDRYMEGYASAVCAHDDAEASAAAFYTLGNHYRAGPIEPERGRRALGAFNIARKLDPSYNARPYFVSEVAGTLFDLKRQLASASWYRRTVELGEDDPFTVARWGDALLDAGRFAEAAERIGPYASPEGAVSERPYWWVRHRLALAFADRFGSSVRRDPTGSRAIPELSGDAPDADRLAVADARLALDPLNATAWFNAGLALHGLGRGLESARAFAYAAACQYGDGEAWANAFVGFVTSGGEDNLAWVAATGYAGMSSAGAAFEDTIADFVEVQDTPEAFGFILDAVELLRSTLPSRPDEDITVRVDGVDVGRSLPHL